MFTLLWHCEEALYWQDTSALFIKTKITSLSQRAFYWRHCQSVWKRSLFFLQPVFGALPRWRGWWWYSGILCGHVVLKKKNVLLIETFISLDIVLKVMLLRKDERSPSYFWVVKVPSAFTLTNTRKLIKKKNFFKKSHSKTGEGFGHLTSTMNKMLAEKVWPQNFCIFEFAIEKTKHRMALFTPSGAKLNYK